jgi:hypothetical protein
MYVKVLENDSSKMFISENELLKEDVFVAEWLTEENVKSYILYDEDIVKSFVLLRLLHRDPLKSHKNPYYLHYVYTFEEYRRKNFAYELLMDIKKHDEVTVFCTDDIVQNLFKKAGYIFSSLDPLYKSLPIYRYP